MRVWLLTQCAVWIPGLAAVAVLPESGRAWVLIGCAGAAMISFAALWRTLAAGGPADRVTGARVVTTSAAVVVVAVAEIVTWPVFLVLVLAALADLLDGWVARRRGATAAGALLDMEADQLGVLLMSVLVAACDRAGPWVLLLPAYRYAYVGALTVLGLQAHDPRPRGDNRRGKLICALTVAALLVALAPVSPEIVRQVAVLVAVLALGWSFGSDAWHLVSRGASRSEPV